MQLVLYLTYISLFNWYRNIQCDMAYYKHIESKQHLKL
jgi:hypothetical protein